MKEKLTVIKVNLISLLRKIEKIECTEEINYELFQKVEEINKKLADIEAIIEELETISEL